jgi:hypothetical protein
MIRAKAEEATTKLKEETSKRQTAERLVTSWKCKYNARTDFLEKESNVWKDKCEHSYKETVDQKEECK